MRQQVIAISTGLAASVLGGCGYLYEDPSSLFLVDVDDERGVFEYYDEYSGWVTLPSSIWRLDLATGEVDRLLPARQRYDVQVSGDYYAAELETEDGDASRIIAGQFSTGEEFTILDRDAELGGRYYGAFVLDGSRVVARTDGGLLVYDLPRRTVEKTVPVDDELVDIIAVGGRYALALRSDPWGGLLVDLEGDEILEIPAIPNDRMATFSDAVLSDTSLITSGYRLLGETITGQEVLMFDIPARTWQTLADYGEYDGGVGIPELLFVSGASESYVLLVAGTPLGEMRLELLDRATGERTLVMRRIAPFAVPSDAQLHNGRVCWVNVFETALVLYDIETQQQTIHPFDIPPGD